MGVVVSIDSRVNMRDQDSCEACRPDKECDFHLGFNTGWDLCALTMRSFIDDGLGE